VSVCTVIRIYTRNTTTITMFRFCLTILQSTVILGQACSSWKNLCDCCYTSLHNRSTSCRAANSVKAL